MAYDLIIIGGGPAGYLAAERAGEAGLNTLLFEKRSVGGVCLNEGCIPTKTLLYSAKLYDGAVNGQKYGVYVENARLDHAAVLARKNRVVKTLVSGVSGALKSHDVTLVQQAAFIEGKTARGFAVRAGGDVYYGARLLVAAGSVNAMPPIPGLREGLQSGRVLTNREILDLKNLPENLAVIGGGVIGLEMASYFNSAGCRVTVVEMLDHIAGETDGDIAKILQNNYKKKGIDFLLSARVTAVTAEGVTVEQAGREISLPAQNVLLSAGRVPRTQGYGLENLQLQMTPRGAIQTDACGRTSMPEVYAAGDVNGRSMLAHTAYREAEVCVNTMLGKRDVMRYHAIPAVIYTNPEVAGVGETEQSARQKGIPVSVVKTSMRYSGRYLAENEGGDGIVKLVIHRDTQVLLGVHMIANAASELIWGAGALIEMEMRVQDIKELVFPHPTVCEIIREAVFQYRAE